MDKMLFSKRNGSNMFILQIYVDDIFFASSSDSLWKKFSNLMSLKFKMSLLRELKVFLSLQINQRSNSIFFCSQSKYARNFV